MKKIFHLPSLIFFLSLFSSTAVLAQHRLVVKVISADRKEPIEGASVRIEFKTNAYTDSKSETSDWDGMVYRSYSGLGRLTINGEASGYYGTIQVVDIWDKSSRDIPVTLILKRNAGVKLVVVDVFEKGTGSMI